MYVCTFCRGASPSSNSGELSLKLKMLRKRLKEIEEEEKELDVQRERLQQCLKNIVDSGTDEKYPSIYEQCICMYVCVSTDDGTVVMSLNEPVCVHVCVCLQLCVN